MVHREPEYCPRCKKPLKAIHSNKGKHFVGDTFVSYEQCDCKPSPTPQPDSGAATCRWVKASERKPTIDCSVIIRNLKDDTHSFGSFDLSLEDTESIFEDGDEWLEELPPSNPQALGVTIDALAQDFKELNNYLDYFCTTGHEVKDAGNAWIAFSDKFRAFEKRVLSLAASPSNAVPVSDTPEFLIWLLNQRYDLIVDTDIWERPGGFLNTTPELYKQFINSKTIKK